MREEKPNRYSNETVYISSYVRLPENIPSAHYNGQIDIGLIINYKTGIIEDNSCTLLTSVAREFINELLVGYSIYENNGVEPLVDIIKHRFHGSSQKCIIAALRDIYKKFLKWKVDSKIE